MQNWLQLGNWNSICDSCGRKFKASSLLKRWDGMMVCKEDWEPRHPQDLLRVQREQIAVPWSRPENVDTFINSCDIWGSSGFAGLGTAGCMRAGNNTPTYAYLLALQGQSPNPDLLFDKVYLLLHMNGVNTTTTFIDNSSLATTVTVGNNTKISTIQSKFNGSSGLFDGTGDYLSVSAAIPWYFLHQQQVSYTVESWIRPTGSFTSGMTLASTSTVSTAGNDYYLLQVDSTGRLVLNIGHVANTYNITLTSSSSLSLDSWQHIAHTYNITNRTHYLAIDGVIVASGVSNVSFPTNSGGNQPITIGSRADSGKSIGFNGNMAEFRVTIAARYTSAYTVPTEAFQNATPTTSVDPYFANVVSLLHAEQLDGTTGPVADVTGKVWTGGSTTTAVKINSPKYGLSSVFGGGTTVLDRFTTPYTTDFDFGSGDFTIEGWIAPITLVPNAFNFRAIFGCTDADKRPFMLGVYVPTSTIYFACSNSSNTDFAVLGPDSSIALNTYTHFAAVRYGNTIQAFVNGVGGTPLTISGSLKVTSAVPTLFYEAYGTSSTVYNGYLDELRVTKGVARYTGTFTPPTESFPNSA